METYDLLLRSRKSPLLNLRSGDVAESSTNGSKEQKWQSHKGLMRSLRQMGCTYVIDLCNQSLAQQRGLESDSEFRELQYESAWRSCNWDNNLFDPDFVDDLSCNQVGEQKGVAFHAHLHRSDFADHSNTFKLFRLIFYAMCRFKYHLIILPI